MQSIATSLIASFTSPMYIGTTAQALLFIVPLIAAISVVYKATKLESMEKKNFIKESATLFGSIFVFILITAIVLLVFTWLVTQ